MRMTVMATLALSTMAAVPTVLHAQDARAVRAAVDQVFDGMRRADSQLVREVFAADARFTVLDTRTSSAVVRAQSVDGWLTAIDGSEGRWDEQIYDVEIKVDGDMASAWTPYTFYLGGEISHCGINSIELLRDASGWKVTQISDTRRTEGCPDPLGSGGR